MRLDFPDSLMNVWFLQCTKLESDCFRKHWRLLMVIVWMTWTVSLTHSTWRVALLANLFEVHCVLTSCSCRIWVLLPFNKTVMWGKVEGRRRGWQTMRWLGGITDSVYMSLSKLRDIYSEGQGSLACCSSCSRKESDTTEWVNSSHHLYRVKERTRMMLNF